MPRAANTAATPYPTTIIRQSSPQRKSVYLALGVSSCVLIFERKKPVEIRQFEIWFLIKDMIVFKYMDVTK